MEENKVIVLPAEIIKNEQVAKNTWQMTLYPRFDFDVTNTSPGQFVCLEPLASDSVMARPFSISMISTSKSTFKIIYRVVGKNTLLMSKLKNGQTIKLWGPLGNSEIIDSRLYDEVWLIGGGIGIAPLLFFEKVISEYQEHIARVFYGVKDVLEMIPLKVYTPEEVQIATEDGLINFHGLITDLFAQKIISKPAKLLVITCGPNRMMQKVSEICQQYNTECLAILEQVMACGIGVCLGCSIKTTKGMKRVCHDGPIFKAEEVIWNELG
ncbi:dihydroorotate dehydrogenase electron transfer subunit [Candidatus Falkowbacteria bacterium]|nr:dihydroorotate dehydrogenase electron transfer subunit [Candidatus Falkowbacteria bacterium]